MLLSNQNKLRWFKQRKGGPETATVRPSTGKFKRLAFAQPISKVEAGFADSRNLSVLLFMPPAHKSHIAIWKCFTEPKIALPGKFF